MSFEAFKAGVEPGGLYNYEEIKILVCYLLSIAENKLTAEDISDIIRKDGLANYFDITQAIFDLQSAGNILIDENHTYALSENGKLIVRELFADVPFTVRQKAQSALDKHLLLKRTLKDNHVEIKQTGGKHTVTISMLENGEELMGISVSVPDLATANLVKENFFDRATDVYVNNLKLLLGYPLED